MGNKPIVENTFYLISYNKDIENKDEITMYFKEYNYEDIGQELSFVDGNMDNLINATRFNTEQEANDYIDYLSTLSYFTDIFNKKHYKVVKCSVCIENI